MQLSSGKYSCEGISVSNHVYCSYRAEFGATYPALVTDALRALASDTHTDDVGSRVEQALGEADELLVAHLLNEVVNSHGVDEGAVANAGAVGELDDLLLSVDLGDLTALAESLLLLGEGVGDGDPDATSAVTSREAESGVGAPVTSDLVQDDVLGDFLDIGSGNTLTEPLALHLRGVVSTVPMSVGIKFQGSRLTLVVGTAQTL